MHGAATLACTLVLTAARWAAAAFASGARRDLRTQLAALRNGSSEPVPAHR